jgi:DNA polymerase V
MMALMDCNNFYVLCERVFNAGLLNRPVIILSNNDGCVVSRSNEAKKLGIKMAEPAFFIKDFLQKHRVAVLSSNYTLYGDMSNRVFNIVKEQVERVEIYSIDEMFLEFNENSVSFKVQAENLRTTVEKQTGIPVSVGVAPTKTLAKVANRLAKSSSGVCVLSSPDEIKTALQNFPVQDVWGIGEQTARFLIKHNVFNAWQLRCLYDNFVRKQFNITTLRIVKELRGTPCIPLEENPPVQKNICIGRSFGNMLTDPEIIREAVSTFASTCSEKLRKKNLSATIIHVFIESNPFRPDLPQHNQITAFTFPEPVNYAPTLIKQAVKMLNTIYKPGICYKKAGVMVSGIEPSNPMQQNLFTPVLSKENNALMNCMDTVNEKYGRNTIRIASQGFERKWWLRQEKLSPGFTTRWNEILTINI